MLANAATFPTSPTLLIGFILLIVIIIIEVVLFQRWLHMRETRVMVAVIIANSASAFPGEAIVTLLAYTLDLSSIPIVICLLFLVTILIEFPVNNMIIRRTRVINIFKTTLKVNLITYALIALWTGMIFRGYMAPKRPRTVADMRAIGTALGSYQVDYNTFPIQPVLGDLEDAALPAVYYEEVVYKGRFRDSWNTPFKYISDGQSYSLISYGKDRKPGGEEEFEADIVYINGQLVAPSSLVR